LQPAFGPTHLRQIPGACERVMEKIVNEWGSQGTVDFNHEMLKVTLDVLGLVAFGKDFGAVDGKLESLVGVERFSL
jgi:cytochrome P450